MTVDVSTAVWQDDTTALLDRTLEISDALGDIPVADVRDRIEIANVDGVTGQAASFVGADEQGPVVAYVCARQVIEATRDLADEIARAGGYDTERVDHTRAEIARLRAT